ncbi:MAG: hypothetical protein O4803_08835 [Trichodesmium sp. St15_bin1_1]|nr:hypothetical protein [Trichodesmium sp. St5_bin2_1]MDE5081737.1 hypothetical protein [Trichodesmium sp. St18_bin1]MDE5089961.1 hypothetical protein [Trichodesmium sp. St16_bin2-tuft]MDE5109079.1 hypothetical protein [Trichodesmium sp. St17_bin3_1_1]MDE5111073.1 hypothetical protein [Trichodesmium sp. St7_bin2_1]MDE5114347.1 hypothetical protein [Trichodesmium sp. St15_bin1_1]MDE5117793.1 hypothetical protein [Trichodesmium sp. St2_bin2_1]MDE5119530.1 hypothetical protein [Trichodesmium sp
MKQWRSLILSGAIANHSDLRQGKYKYTCHKISITKTPKFWFK